MRDGVVVDSAVFVALEGGEGSGKSTQARELAGWLRGQSLDVLLTREPGDTALGERVRELLLAKGDTAPTSRTEALLYAADRAQHVETVIKPALANGSVVITDRYVDSSRAYQGAGRELQSDDVAWLSEWATTGLKPDLTILLDIAPAVGLQRVGSRGEHDRLESESLPFHERVRQAFLDFAQAEPHRYVIIDATHAPAVVAQQIHAAVAPWVHALSRGGSAWVSSASEVER